MTYSTIHSADLLDMIILEFPENKKEITRLYKNCIDFIEICEDYMVCMNSIQELKKMKKTTNVQKLTDLETVSLELREELLSMI